MERTNNRIHFLVLIGIVSSFTLANAQMLLSPALSQLADQFPDVSYAMMTYMSTVPSLIGIPMTMVAGWLIKKGVKYKTLLLASILLIMLGGFAPYFLHSFSAWMAARIIFGIGFGCGIPISGSITIASFQGDSLTRVQGLGSVVQNLTGVVLPFIAGIVCAVQVEYVWFLHLLFVLPFLLVLFFVREPEKSGAKADDAEEEKAGGTKIPGAVYYMSLSYGLVFMFVYPIVLNMAGILIGEGLGTASMSGTMTALFFIGGMISGSVFPRVFKAADVKLFPILCIGSAIGMLCAFLGRTAPLLMAANVLTGMCTMMIWPASLTVFGRVVPAGSYAMSCSLFGFCINLFSFLTTPYSAVVSSLTGGNPRVHLLTGALGCLGLGLVWLLAIRLLFYNLDGDLQ